tara:strand:+ start:775 stop:1812 length:1038 start_codon:yes stop_codon:yes gene_type:complete
MILKGFGEVLTSVMTVNPALGDLPSASAILDTSNYTFQAVTFGKDADGFAHHSHTVSSVQYVDGESSSGVSAYDSGVLLVLNYESGIASAVSSYTTSATYSKFIDTYNSVPNDPSPLDTRLERAPTSSTQLSDYQYASALPNLGHYANPAIDSQLSAIWNKVGGFGPSSQEDYHFYSSTSSYIFSGQVSSYFNANSIMDKNGYLTVNPKGIFAAASRGTEASGGAVLLSSVSFPVSNAIVSLNVTIQSGDACTLAAFGGVKHLGVYCLDLPDLLSSGLLPPYNWDALNNTRKYKLVASLTTLDDPLFHRDVPALSLGGFEQILNKNTGSGFTFGGPNINLIFDFK